MWEDTEPWVDSGTWGARRRGGLEEVGRLGDVGGLGDVGALGNVGGLGDVWGLGDVGGTLGPLGWWVASYLVSNREESDDVRSVIRSIKLCFYICKTMVVS